MSRNPPLISVVMAVYNGEPYLAAAVDSILSQSCGDFELIVVDDASTDSTAEVLGAYDDPRIICIRNEENLRQTRSLNRGLACASGRFIARHDADDVSHPRRFQRQLEAFADDPTLGLVGTAYEIIDDAGRVLETVVPPADDHSLKLLLEQGNIFCHGSVMMTLRAVAQAGGYNEAFPVTQDYDLWLRIAEHYRLSNLDAPLYQFRFGSETVSRTRRPLQLAYRRLALELSQQRRRGEPEGPIPNDVLAAYPPERNRLFGDARRSVYLYFVAGKWDRAAASFAEAQRLDGADSADGAWPEWTLARARELSQLRKDENAGASLINWICGLTPMATWQKRRRQFLGAFYADQAFQAYRLGSRKALLESVLQAAIYDPRWLKNRGLWSITLAAVRGKSLITRLKVSGEDGDY